MSDNALDYYESLKRAVSPILCTTCNDQGVLKVEVEGQPKHPLNGKSVPCPNPDCKAGQAASERLMKNRFTRAGVPEAYQPMTLDTFKQAITAAGGNWKGKGLAYATAETFINLYPAKFSLMDVAERHRVTGYKGSAVPRHSVVFTGDTGQGKTGLAAAIFNGLIERGIVPVYIRVQDVIAEIQSTYGKSGDPNSPTADEKFYTLITCPVLILDEFNLENYSADRLEIVERVIRGRHGKKLPFIATTNLDDKDFRKWWGERIGDIVLTAHWIGVGGVKLRQTVTGVESW